MPEAHGLKPLRTTVRSFQAAIFATTRTSHSYDTLNGAKVNRPSALFQFLYKTMGYIYCLYSTEDGYPRYIGQTSTDVGSRLKQHITCGLEKQPGALYDWMRDVWRRGYEVDAYALQEAVTPKDLDLFERYWMQQFCRLLNVKNGELVAKADSPVAVQIKAAITKRLAR